MPDADLGGQEEAGEGGDHRRQEVGAEMDEIDADAVPLGRFLAEADGAQPEPAPRPVEPEIAEDRRGDQDDEEGDRQKPMRVLQEAGEASLIRPPGDGRR